MVNEPNLEGGDIPLKEESTNPEPEKAIQEPSESETPPTSEGENPVKKSKELETALAQKKHWREKYEKLEASKDKESEPIKPSIPLSDNDWRTKTDFLLNNRNKDYSRDEFDHISIVSKEKGVSLDEAAKLSADYINFNRDKVENSKKVPGSSSALGAGGKSDKDIASMTDAEHEAFWKKTNDKKGTRI